MPGNGSRRQRLGGGPFLGFSGIILPTGAKFRPGDGRLKSGHRRRGDDQRASMDGGSSVDARA